MENFNLTNFGLNLTIFEKEDSFLAFLAFFGKNRNFFHFFFKFCKILRPFEFIYFFNKFWGIETRYTKFQDNPTRNSHLSDIQSWHRDPKFKPSEAISPYVLIQNAENTKIAAKSRKINIFCSNKNHAKFWKNLSYKIFEIYFSNLCRKRFSIILRGFW